MDTIRQTLKRKFGIWLDQRCDKGLDTYGHELDDCPDDKFDWRDMLIEELLDGLQYQEKEIKRLKKELESTKRIAQFFSKHIERLEKPKEPFFKGYKPKPPYFDLDD
jgi:hypothetical protein